MSTSLTTCCQQEAARSLRRHRDVATCDGCGALLLAYGVERDAQRTVEELERHGQAYRQGTQGELTVVARLKS